MGDSIEASETVQRIHKAGDEANSIIAPAGVVDPGLEHKGRVLMSWGTCDDGHQDDEPSDLQVEERELIQSRNDSIAKQHDGRRQSIENLINDKCLPGLEG